MGNTSAWPEWFTGEQLGVARTSYQPPQQEDKVLIPSSPRKNLTTMHTRESTGRATTTRSRLEAQLFQP
jgi:hypothetical protein